MARFPASQKALQRLTGPPQRCGMGQTQAKRGKRS